MKTEAEARKCWCPFGRVAMLEDKMLQTGMPAFNRVAEAARARHSDAATMCIASECMAWRWDGEPISELNHPNMRGHCGLAGKP